jgi:hypothetical protein
VALDDGTRRGMPSSSPILEAPHPSPWQPVGHASFAQMGREAPLPQSPNRRRTITGLALSCSGRRPSASAEVGARLLTRRNAEVSGPMRAGARVRPTP